MSSSELSVVLYLVSFHVSRKKYIYIYIFNIYMQAKLVIELMHSESRY